MLSPFKDFLIFVRKQFPLRRVVKGDQKRKQFLLHILLIGLVILAFVAFCVKLNAFIFSSPQEGLVPFIIFLFLCFFLFLLMLSYFGHTNVSSYLFITFLLFSAFYTSYRFAADSGQALLMYSLAIIISGILISSRFAFLITIIIVAGLSAIEYLHIGNFISPDTTWRKTLPSVGKIIVFNTTLAVIGIVAWLSNREIEKALKLAQDSERALKQERDLLEIKVEERTRELRQAQFEKMSQLYRFAEIGKQTAGFLHDLASPISLVSLNIHRLNDKNQQKELENIDILLKRALQGTKYLENFVLTARKQFQQQDIRKTVSLNNEIKQVIHLLQYKANKNKVKILFHPQKQIKLFTNQIKFNQIIMNLLSNAIDAYEPSELQKKREINLSLETTDKNIVLRVQNWGKEINKDDLQKIFDPFFTTKKPDKGTGLGLSITREIIEFNFGGTITVKSDNENGTIFTIYLPKKYPV